MCYMPWHLPWKLNLLNCCLESHTSINWRGSVDIWLSDISRRDGVLQASHLLFEHTWLAQQSKSNHWDISLMQAPIIKCLNNEAAAAKSEPWQRDRCHKMISNLLIFHFFGVDETFGMYQPTEVLPLPSQHLSDPAIPPLRGWSPPCSWAPWCRRWHRV